MLQFFKNLYDRLFGPKQIYIYDLSKRDLYGDIVDFYRRKEFRKAALLEEALELAEMAGQVKWPQSKDLKGMVNVTLIGEEEIERALAVEFDNEVVLTKDNKTMKGADVKHMGDVLLKREIDELPDFKVKNVEAS